MPSCITVTEQDYDLIAALLEAADRKGHPQDGLERGLAQARIVPAREAPRDLVTMNARFSFEDLETGQTRTVTLVLPRDADIDAGRVSVMTPLGSALLGLRAGETIDWPIHDGTRHRLRVVRVDGAVLPAPAPR